MSSTNILEYFGDMPDPREDNKRHQLLDSTFHRHLCIHLWCREVG